VEVEKEYLSYVAALCAERDAALADLKLNATMLAKQTDLAREVENQLAAALATRAEDVEKLAYIIEDAATVGAVSWKGVARAVAEYMKEDK